MDRFLDNVSNELPFLLMLILGAGLIAFWQWAAIQRRRMAHAEHLSALEKGAPIPPEPEGNGSSHRQPPTREAFLLRGLLWSAIGLGILVTGAAAAWVQGSWDKRHEALTFACIGFVPLALGLGYLLYTRLTEGKGDRRI
jgi:hypothetical protein